MNKKLQILQKHKIDLLFFQMNFTYFIFDDVRFISQETFKELFFLISFFITYQ